MKLPSVLLFSLAVTCGTFGTISSAKADDPTVLQARARFKEGVAYFDAGRFEEARTAFLQAYTLKPHPAVLLNLAQSELRAGHTAEAANHFADFLANNAGAKATEISSAQKGLDEAKASVGELTVTIDSLDGELFIDGASVGNAPLNRPIYVTPGEHVIEAREGTKTATKRITASAGAPVSANLSFAPPPAAEPPHQEVAIAVPPPALVVSTPVSPPREAPPAGRPPFFAWLFDSPVGITGVGVTAAGLGVGIAGSIVASNKYSSAQDAQDQIVTRAHDQNDSGVICSGGTSPKSMYVPACEERQSRLDAGDTWTTVAVIGYAGAAAAAAGTVIYYLAATGDSGPAESPMPPGSTARITPVVTDRFQGLSFDGTF